MTRSDLSFTAAVMPRATLAMGVMAILLLAWMAGFPTIAAQRCMSGDADMLAQSASGRIAFVDRVRTVTLSPTCGPVGAAVKRARSKARFFLVVEDLRASTQPGAVFDIALAPQADARPGIRACSAR